MPVIGIWRRDGDFLTEMMTERIYNEGAIKFQKMRILVGEEGTPSTEQWCGQAVEM